MAAINSRSMQERKSCFGQQLNVNQCAFRMFPEVSEFQHATKLRHKRNIPGFFLEFDSSLYYQCHKTKDGEIFRACDTYENAYMDWEKDLQERVYLEDPATDGRAVFDFSTFTPAM